MCQDQTNKYGIIIILPNWRNHTKCNIWLDWTNNRRTCAKWPFSAQIALWYSDPDTTIAHLTVNRVWRWANSIRLPRPQSVKSTYRIFNFFFNHCASGCECDENPYVAFRIFFSCHIHCNNVKSSNYRYPYSFTHANIWYDTAFLIFQSSFVLIWLAFFLLSFVYNYY